MTQKKFHREEYPLETLNEFGLSPEMVYDLPNFVHETLEMGGKSPLLPILIPQPFGVTRCYAKFQLVRLDGGVDLLFSPKLKAIDLSQFSEGEQDMLFDGKAIVADVMESDLDANGTSIPTKVKSFVQLDRETNAAVYAPTAIIGKNLSLVCSEFDISDSSLEGFWHGYPVTIEEPDVFGNLHKITIGIDLFSDKGVIALPCDAAQWQSAMRRQMPEYSFGNDGCWVNRNGLLHYVKETDFGSDIINELERQARKAGMTTEGVMDNVHDIGLGEMAAKDIMRQMGR